MNFCRVSLVFVVILIVVTNIQGGCIFNQTQLQNLGQQLTQAVQQFGQQAANAFGGFAPTASATSPGSQQ